MKEVTNSSETSGFHSDPSDLHNAHLELLFAKDSVYTLREKKPYSLWLKLAEKLIDAAIAILTRKIK